MFSILNNSELVKKFKKSDLIIKGGLFLLFLLILVAIFAPILAPYDPNSTSLLARLRPPLGFEKFKVGFLLGTDELGRDMLSRLIYGLRFTLFIALVGSLISMTIGTLIGVISGYVGGIIDNIFMMLVDIQIAFPGTLMALLLISVFGSSITILIFVVGISGWENYARVVRGQVIQIKNEPYVSAAQVAGAKPRRIILLHMLPNIASPIIVLYTFGISNIILLESSLSFLGLGIQPPTATLGSMTGLGRDFLSSYPHICVLPAIVILLIALVFLLLGDWLRDSLDVRLQRK
jgi:peptide/nickel transport system permease protein